MRRPIARDINQRKRAVGSQVANWQQGFPTFTPLTLRPLLWLDAADTSTITTSGSSVTQWNDKSGNAINVSQGTAARQPQSGTTLMNGLNTLSFDGGDHLRSTNGAISAGTLTGFIVFSLSSYNFVNALMGIPNEATVHSNPYFRWAINGVIESGNKLDFRIDTQFTRGGIITTNMPTIAWAQSGDGDAYLGRTRVIDSAARTVTYPNSVPFIIGANAANGEGSTGLFSEILLFDRQMQWQECLSLITYLAMKWNIVI